MTWQSVKLGDVCEVKRGTTITEKQAIAGDVPVVAGGLTFSYTHNASNRIGQVITISGSGANAGYVNFWETPIFASDCSTVQPRSESVDVKFVFYFLKSKQEFINNTLRSGAAQPHVYAKDIAQLAMPLPTLAEQKRIAAILDKAAEIKAKREQAIAKLDELAQSTFVEMFGDTTKKNKWTTVTLDELIEKDDRINYGVVQPGDDVEDGVALIRVGDLVANDFSRSSLKLISASVEAAYKRSRIKGNEILISCVGSIGVVVPVTKDMIGFNIARAVARVPVSNLINRTYLENYLKSEYVQRYFISELRTVSQPTLNIKQICETIVMCPPLSLQNEYEMRIKNAIEVRDAAKKSNNVFNNLIASLQHQAFTTGFTA